MGTSRSGRWCRSEQSEPTASLDYFFLPDTDEQWIADYLELDNQVGAEDRALVERVQVGLRSGVITEGTLMPESERLIAHFERLLVDALGADQ